jgi:hypothetical protein
MFFFGTLMDPDVLALVLDHPLDRLTIAPATVRGHLRLHVAGRSYPMLVPHPGGRVAGHLVGGLDHDDRARLAYYEGWEYDVGPIAVTGPDGRTVTAEMYVCPPEVAADRRPWRLDRWQSVHKAGYLPRLRRLMAGFETGGPRPPLSPGAVRGATAPPKAGCRPARFARGAGLPEPLPFLSMNQKGVRGIAPAGARAEPA